MVTRFTDHMSQDWDVDPGYSSARSLFLQTPLSGLPALVRQFSRLKNHLSIVRNRCGYDHYSLMRFGHHYLQRFSGMSASGVLEILAASLKPFCLG